MGASDFSNPRKETFLVSWLGRAVSPEIAMTLRVGAAGALGLGGKLAPGMSGGRVVWELLWGLLTSLSAQSFEGFPMGAAIPCCTS